MTRYRSCSRCAFVVSETGEDGVKRLWCHRAPPTPVLMDPARGAINWMFALVMPMAWCGEWRLAWRRLFKGHEA